MGSSGSVATFLAESGTMNSLASPNSAAEKCCSVSSPQRSPSVSCGANPTALLSRHSRGDWGDVDPEDRTANDTCLRTGGRILSSYRLDTETKVWVITEADRSSTCILLPEEY